MRQAHELLLSSGKLVVKENKFYFVPKPVQADTIPGKDCLALSKAFGMFVCMFSSVFYPRRARIPHAQETRAGGPRLTPAV